MNDFHGKFTGDESVGAVIVNDHSRTINRQALIEFIHFGYCRRSIYENDFLPPLKKINSPIALSQNYTPSPKSLNESVAELTQLLNEVIAENASDNDGVFLSSGIDSSLIAAILATKKNINTLSIGFREDTYNESDIAKKIAQHLRTTHHEFYFDEKIALSLIPQLPKIYPQPFGDSSQLPTLYACQSARDITAKIFTGDGADEFFGGYERYFMGNKFWRYWRYLPYFLRRNVKKTAPFLPTKLLNQLGDFFSIRYGGDKLQRILRSCSARNFAEFYQLLMTNNYASSIIAGEITAPLFDEKSAPFFADDFTAQAMLIDQQNYLPFDTLVKTAYPASAHNLTLVNQFLDQRVIDFAQNLPREYKISRTQTKIILRRILAQYLPASLIAKRKKGFAIPLASWLRGGLREWANDVINSADLMNDGFLCARTVRELWQQHGAEKIDASAVLWNVLMWQMWYHR